MKPNFIGIGGQRCATTWIFSCLKEHPEVCKTRGKEIHFFSYWYHRGYEWYERHFKKCSNYKAIGEFSTSYLYDESAPQRIYNYNPDMKIIVCLRNPIERAYSQHLWHVSLGHVTGRNLNFQNAIKDNPMYVEQGLYYKHLRRWISYFPLWKKLHVVIFEDMLKGPLSFIQSIYRFLKIDENYVPSSLNKVVNKAVIPKNLKLGRLINKISPIFRIAGMSSFIDFIKYLNSQKQETICKMNDKTRKELRKIFYKENKKLAILLNRNLTFWDE